MPLEASPTIRSGAFHAVTPGGASLVTTSAVAAVAAAAAADTVGASESPLPSSAATVAPMQPCLSAPAAIGRFIAATALAKCETPEAGGLASVLYPI